MAPDRWEQVKHFFQAALERNPSERAGFLDGISAFDPNLRKEVESLLASHSEDSFLKKPPPEHQDEPLEAPSLDNGSVTRERTDETDQVESERIGPYRILGEIGHGGMGIVFEAEQEKPVRRKVALKLIKWGMDTKAVIARFESERQALALMNHPNIASVHDAGATDEGRPYFAMELVRGELITEYCDKNRLTVRERLVLFIQVCEGVQHAHQKGIIHRDIKPSNILVTTHDDKAVPKLIDFGVAKATAQRLTEKTVYTELGQFIGTPEYMSPEQAEMTGLDVDTRTDVYSLGVFLYELLVGAQPFDPTELRRAGFEGIRRIIREKDPLKPSTKLHSLSKATTDSAKNRNVEPSVLERELRGDLDWITMKALEKNRTRRYGSAFELAADIGRHLRHEVVLAGPPSTAYRVRKFVRRHRLAVVASTIVFLALVLGITGTTIGLIRARTAERTATREADKANAINAFLQETLGSVNPMTGLGHDVTVLEALDGAVGKIEESFPDAPEIEAAVKDTIAAAYLELGQYEAAEPLVTSALEIRRNTLGNEHVDVARSLHDLGVLKLDRKDEERNDLNLAEKSFREALPILRRYEGDEKQDVQICLGNTLNALALIQRNKGEYDAAERLYREALAIGREITGSQDADLLVAKILGNLGALFYEKNDIDSAERLLREAIETERQALAGRLHPRLLGHLFYLGYIHRDKQDYEAAERLYREAVEMSRVLFGEGSARFARDLRALSLLLQVKHGYEEAEALARRALSINLEVSGGEHRETAASLRVLAGILMDQGHYEQAEPHLRNAVEIFRRTSRQNSLAVCRSLYGECLAKLGRYQQAEDHLLTALPILEAAQRKSLITEAGRTAERLVELYESWGKPEKVAEYRALLDKTGYK